MSELGVTADIEEVSVTTDEEAAGVRMLGSPTIQIDDVDVEPGAAERSDFGTS
jgi:hypothetical protein